MKSKSVKSIQTVSGKESAKKKFDIICGKLADMQEDYKPDREFKNDLSELYAQIQALKSKYEL